jgi:hypothetical protein
MILQYGELAYENQITGKRAFVAMVNWNEEKGIGGENSQDP